MGNGQDMQVTITGNKFPMVVLFTGFIAVITSIIYATVWLTKLDDRVLTNAAHIAEIQSEVKEVTKTLEAVQSNCARQAVILDELEKRMNRQE